MFKLKTGDKVGIISPASALEECDISAGLAYLKQNGLIPVLGKHTRSQYRYMGGTDSERAQDIIDFFKNTEIKALFCTRGGAGSLRLLPYLDYDIIKNNPKPIFGLSDITALQNAVFAKTKNISYSGFLLVYDFREGQIKATQDKDLKTIFQGQPLEYHSGKTVNTGATEGTLLGGNITAFNMLCGTPYFPDLSNKILLLEDIGIKSYQLDMMLQQLKLQKGFSKIKGLIFGQFSSIRIIDECDGTIEDNIRYFCQDLNIPVIMDFEYGHIPARHILPIGGEIHFDAKKCLIRTLTDN